MLENSVDKVNWFDKQIWKRSLTSTFLCLLGCSIGSMGTNYFLMHINWYLMFLISLLIGLISCILFTTLWDIFIRKINFKVAFLNSIKMSIVSIFIMITVENIILHLVFPQSATHEMRNMQNMMYSYSVVMMIAMALGFLFALPYNYYQIEKNGKECHS